MKTVSCRQEINDVVSHLREYKLIDLVDHHWQVVITNRVDPDEDAPDVLAYYVNTQVPVLSSFLEYRSMIA